MTTKKDIQFLADESAFSLADWQKAKEALIKWCQKKNLVVTDEQALSYVHCCSLAASAKPFSGTLESITLEYLESYGIEQAST